LIKDLKIIEYNDCLYGTQEDVIKYLLAEVNNILNREGCISDDEIDSVKDMIDTIRDLHDNYCGVVKVYDNPMCGIDIKEV